MARRFKTTARFEVDSIGVNSIREARAEVKKVIKARLRKFGVDYLIQILDLQTREVAPSAVDSPPSPKFRMIRRTK